jgi:O-antigen/teichoic acid export membrane protein
MGIVIRQSIFTTMFSYLGVLIGYINVLWLFPKFLSADEIGLTRVIQDIAILLVPFAQFGMSQSLLKFYPVFNPQNKKTKGFLSFFLIASLAAFLVFLFIILIFREPVLSIFEQRSPEVKNFFWLSLILTFILIVTGIYESYSRSLLKTIFPNFVKEVLLRVFTALIILLYYLKYLSFVGLLYSLTFAYGLSLFILFLYLVRLKAISVHFDFKFVNKAFVKKLFNYSIFTFIGTSGFILVMKVDSLMVTTLLGLTENGIYTTVFYIAAVVELPKRAIVQITTPLISRAFEENNLQEIKILYRKSSLNQLIIGALIFIGIWANLENIFSFIPNREVFELGKAVVLIIGFGKLIDMTAGINGEIIIMSKYYKFNIITVIVLAIATITANLYMIPAYGMNGAAWATTLAILLFNILKFIFIWLKFKMQPFSMNTLKIFIIAILVFYTSGLIPFPDNAIVDIIIRSTYITLIYSFFIIYFNISPDVNAIFQTILNKAGIKK